MNDCWLLLAGWPTGSASPQEAQKIPRRSPEEARKSHRGRPAVGSRGRPWTAVGGLLRLIGLVLQTKRMAVAHAQGKKQQAEAGEDMKSQTFGLSVSVFFKNCLLWW